MGIYLLYIFDDRIYMGDCILLCQGEEARKQRIYEGTIPSDLRLWRMYDARCGIAV